MRDFSIIEAPTIIYVDNLFFSLPKYPVIFFQVIMSSSYSSANDTPEGYPLIWVRSFEGGYRATGNRPQLLLWHYSGAASRPIQRTTSLVRSFFMHLTAILTDREHHKAVVVGGRFTIYSGKSLIRSAAAYLSEKHPHAQSAYHAINAAEPCGALAESRKSMRRRAPQRRRRDRKQATSISRES